MESITKLAAVSRRTVLSLMAAAAAAAVSPIAAAEQKGSRPGTRIVVDDNGDKVEVPEKIERVVVTNILPLASAVAVYLNDGSRIVGMHPASYSAAKNGLLGELYPEVLKADTGFIQGANLNIEALMALRPDVVLVNAPDRRMIDMIRGAGLAAFGISPSKWHYDVIETHNRWMQSLAQLFPEAKGKGELIEKKSREIAKMVADRTKDLPREERARILFIFRYDAKSLVTSGKNFFGQYWCDAVGGINVAEGITADNSNAVIGMEEVYGYDPDVIFITNFTAALPEDIYGSKIGGDDWSPVKAVREKRVYKMPLGIYRSYTPSADTPLTLLWMAKRVYPERFKDVDLTTEVKKYYQTVFGVSLTEKQISRMFSPEAAASRGATGKTRTNE
mgnify:FL=1